MLRFLFLLIILGLSLFVKAADDISLSFYLDNEGSPFYYILFEGDTIVAPSRLGVVTKNDSICNAFKIEKVSESDSDEEITLPWGANKNIRNRNHEVRYDLRHVPTNIGMSVIFKVFDNSVAFRYIVGDTITDELTEVAIYGNPKAFWSWADFNTYEKEYYCTSLQDAPWSAFPLVLKYENGTHVAIREAVVMDYPDGSLKNMGDNRLRVFLTPLSSQIPGSEINSITPWRVVTIARSAVEMVNDDSPLCLAPLPSDDAYIGKPMTYIGIWWEYHLGTSDWTEGERHGATTDKALRYIDFASEHNIGGVLVEGWNKGWAKWGDTDFITPADDYDVVKVAEYAREKNVRLIMHHETGGDIGNYESRLDSAFSFCGRLGIHDVKTGHAGVIPNGWNHHSKNVVSHFKKVVETAARYGIALDMHEPVCLYGWERTYPNLMTREGVRGLEWEAWSNGNTPRHTATLPFTRGLVGPMDYTPGIFDVLYVNAKDRCRWNCDEPTMRKSRVHSTVAHQLALMVALYSPWVMVADCIENYEGHPMFGFVESLNPDYDESMAIQGEIGEFIVVARRTGSTWYVAAVTNEEEREIEIPLDFIGDNSHEAVLYLDGYDADYERNPTSYVVNRRDVAKSDVLKVRLARGGGCAIVIK
ncbi:MAG: glycoside hydrolase family 97 protein [Candidatus Limimorpha sp.]